MKKKPGKKAPPASSWEKERDRLKNLWVICALGFWVSVAVQAALYLTKGEISFILASIILGLMVLGLAMKIRYHNFLRSKPGA